MEALIGHTGFVGTTLKKQHAFSHFYRSTDITEIRGRSFELIVCAGAPAQKWIANAEPEKDAAAIDRLISQLEQVKAQRFLLISTVDVFLNADTVDEASPVTENGLHAYGFNRRRLEKFVAAHFPDHLIVRMPGLVGPGLRKNVIFDFLNENNLSQIDSRGVFQFYPMVNLWSDIETAMVNDLRLLHLTAEPISVAEVARKGFGLSFEQHPAAKPPCYDLRSKHAALFGGAGQYQYSAKETLLAIRAYAQSEPKTVKN